MGALTPQSLLPGLALLALLAASAAMPLQAADPPSSAIGKAMADLASPDEAIRKTAFETIENEGDARLVPAMEAYRDGLLASRDGKLVVYGARVDVEGRGRVYPLKDALTGDALKGSDGASLYEESLPASPIRAPRPQRAAVSALVSSLSLLDPDPARRKQAIIDAGDRADAKLLDSLRKQLTAAPDGPFAPALRESMAKINLAHGTRIEKLTAVSELGALASRGGSVALDRAMEIAQKLEPRDHEVEAAITSALQSIERYQTKIRWIHNTFAGLSQASILILLALGLAIIFGLMGVINMAHGEFMVVGAFTTYLVAQAFQRFLPNHYDWYMLAAIPASFLVAAITGYIVERTIICRLYGRPLETLLATFGVSLILIQLMRVCFGDTLSVSSPRWLQGGWEVAPDLVLGSLRLFIIALCVVAVLTVYAVIRYTKLGLLLRATTQNREMASALGVPTRSVDGLTFAFGTGLAGLAGVIVPLYNKLNPNVGQEYIVESFQVVVVGGVGNLAGVLFGGASLGFIAKYVEPLFQEIKNFASSASVLSRVLVLMLVVVFLTMRPSGLFPARGRLADA